MGIFVTTVGSIRVTTSGAVRISVGTDISLEQPPEQPPFDRPGAGGIAPKDPRIHFAELEFFRNRDMHGRHVAAMVPPPVIAQRNLTTPQYPSSRPVVVPIPPGRHK